MSFRIQVDPVCSICGGGKFSPGFGGRMTYERPPKCDGCGSMERHRILRQVYNSIGPAYFANMSCIQFSADPAVPRDWFREFMISEYGGQNSQDICDIKFPDGSFDWVICNHVLEHIPDDVKALRELLRIAGDRGVVQISFPMPHFLPRTQDWGYPKKEDHDHYRYYGADVTDRLIRSAGAAACMLVVGGDSATGAWENTYILANSADRVHEVCAGVIRQHPTALYLFK